LALRKKFAKYNDDTNKKKKKRNSPGKTGNKSQVLSAARRV
jgi:hypothetical protein